jgi:hypothetical protein
MIEFADAGPRLDVISRPGRLTAPRGGSHHPGRKTEDLPPVHLDTVKFSPDGFEAGGDPASAGGHAEQISSGTVGAHHAREHSARLLAGLEQERAGAVAEEDAGGAVVPVDDSGEGLRADHQSVVD